MFKFFVFCLGGGLGVGGGVGTQNVTVGEGESNSIAQISVSTLMTAGQLYASPVNMG